MQETNKRCSIRNEAVLSSGIRIMQEHGGNMNALSKLGKGTTFILKLPMVSEGHIFTTTEQSDLIESRGT